MAKNSPASNDLPTSFDDSTMDGQSEEFFLDFSDVEAAEGFPVVPRGWYKVRVIDDNERVIQNAGGKLPQGTKGINFTMVIIEGEHTDKKVFSNFWLHPTSFPYLKAFMKKSGAFTQDQLASNRISPREICETLEGAELWADVRVKKYMDNDQNDVKGFKALDEKESGSGNGTTSSILPD